MVEDVEGAVGEPGDDWWGDAVAEEVDFVAVGWFGVVGSGEPEPASGSVDNCMASTVTTKTGRRNPSDIMMTRTRVSRRDVVDCAD
jgi:hypothetical protein